MSTTTPRKTSTDQPPAPESVETPPPRPRRRPWHVATAVALGAVGMIIGAVTWTSTSAMTSVLVARDSMHRGDVITRDAFTTARIYDDDALDPVTPAELDGLLGQRISLDIAAGSIVTREAVAGFEPTREGTYLLGVRLDAAHAPGSPVLVGDKVLAVVTPAAGSVPTGGDAAPTSARGEVAAVNVDPETGAMVLDLLVSESDGPMLAAHAAGGNVAVLLEPRSTDAGGEG